MAKKYVRLDGKLMSVGDKLVRVNADKPYLTFSAPETFSISVANPGWNGTMEYSTDASTWTTWNGSSISGTMLYIRGIGNTRVTGNGSDSVVWTLTGSNIACEGNIETLLDYATVRAGNHPSMTESCYSCMFQGCTGLTAAPELPATTLTSNCYFGMFRDCTGLTVAPELPATTLGSYCYSSMFSGCTNLTTAPALPATSLSDWCYDYMFYGCTSLTAIPALPATTLAYCCYTGMFKGCTSLKLSATQTGTYTKAYRIPTSGTGSFVDNEESVCDMFTSTGGTFTDIPEINTTYYLDESCSIVPAT